MMSNNLSYGYKLVHIYNEKYISSSSSNYSPKSSKWILEYKINEWTKPIIPNSKLFAFHTLSDALTFLRLSTISENKHNFALFRCRLKNALFSSNENYLFNMAEDFDLFWLHNFPKKIDSITSNQYKKSNNEYYMNICLADEIKLLERVEL